MLTRSKLAQLHEDRVEAVTLAQPGDRGPARRWLLDPETVAGPWSIGIAVSWWVFLQAFVAAIPEPADPRASAPLWATLAYGGFFALVGVMGGTLALRARVGLVLSVVAGGLGLLDTVACPLSGHHETIGAWWYLGMAGFTGLIAASLVGLRRSRPAPAPATR